MQDDDTDQQSADDALEPQDGIYNPLRDEDKLAEDNDPPAAPADDIRHATIDDPSTDDGIDSDELYQEGLSGATNADDEAVGPDEEPRPLEPEDD